MKDEKIDVFHLSINKTLKKESNVEIIKDIILIGKELNIEVSSNKSFNDNLSSSSNIFIYNNLARSIELYKQYSKEDYLSIFDEKIEIFRKFEATSFQVSTEKNGSPQPDIPFLMVFLLFIRGNR